MFKRSNASDLYLADALPYLESIIEEGYEEYPSVAAQIFNVRDMKNGIAQHTQMGSLPAVGEVGEGEEIPQETIQQGYSKTYLARKFGVLLSVTQEAIDDEKFDSISKNAAKMGGAVRAAEEIDAANVFNNGFSSTGPDGKVLFATDHPGLSAGSPTISNKLATDSDLSITTLKNMVTLMKQTTDTAGKKIRIRPKTLLVPSGLEYLAHELLNSTYLPGGSDNNVNSMDTKGGLYNISPLCWEYLTDDDAWFLLGDKKDHELYQFWSKRPELKTSQDFKTDVALQRILARWDVGYSDFRGVYGTPGA